MTQRKQGRFYKKAQPKAKKAPAKSTALARRPVPRGTSQVRAVTVLPPEATANAGQLTEVMELGVLGLVEVQLTAKEEAILARPVNVDDIRVKPDLGGIIYLSHPTYTRLFNEAFGRLGWGIVPCAKPTLQGHTINCPYVLYIHGKPAAFAVGEQEYHPDNKRQTYGDAFEATVASALRRCAKRLGVGLELWDKPFAADYLAEHCVLVQVKQKDGSVDRAWRRRQDRPLPYEIGKDSQEPRGGERTQARPQTRPPTPGRPTEAPAAPAGVPISEPQVKRFYAILNNSGRNEAVIKDWLLVCYGYAHVKEIGRNHYEAICTAIEGEGKLP